MFPPERFDIFLSLVGCSKGLDALAYIFLSILITYKGSGRGAWGPPVLRGECEEVFVFELSGTINTAYYTIDTTYQVATT